jgi:Flp pilus assembly protein TadG
MTGNRASLLADESGASLIELALVAPLLAGLLMGMVDISRGYSEKLQLEQAAQRSIERVMQQKIASGDIVTTLESEAAAGAGVPVSAADADSWLECSSDGVSWARTTSVTCSTTYYARYVSVSVVKSFTPMFGGRFFPNADANGAITITGKASMRLGQ